MKILWVEDFDHGKSRELKNIFLNSYGLMDNFKNKELVIKENLKSALSSMQKKPFPYDLVLLDINIKKNANDISEEIYDKYFKNYINETFFHQQWEAENGGILVYLYLREVANFPKNKIAFISAFVHGDDIELYKGMKEFDDPFQLGEQNKTESSEEEIQEVTEKMKKVEASFTCLSNTGIEITHKYPKPSVSGETAVEKKYQEHYSDKFQENFLKPNQSDYVDIRRNLIELTGILEQTCKIIREQENCTEDYLGFLSIMQSEIFTTKIKGKESLMSGSEVFQGIFFWDLLKKCRNLPLSVDSDLEGYDILEHIARDILYCCDCFTTSKFPTQKTSAFQRASAISLKKVRNWFSHADAGKNANNHEHLIHVNFMFPLFFRLCFNIEQIATVLGKEMYENYLQHEKAFLLSFLDESKELPPLKDIIFPKFVVHDSKKPESIYNRFLLDAKKAVQDDSTGMREFPVYAKDSPEYNYILYAYQKGG